jgi:molybdopterin synthase catalytic subunit
MQLILQEQAFDPWALAGQFSQQCKGAGALVTFNGIVRGDDGLTHLEIEHYPDMSRPAIMKIMQEAQERFGLIDAMAVHRFGVLAAGETIMMVATAALHRKQAFDGATFLMDYLKSRAPFWKKEHRPNGALWVEAKAEDEAALSRW